MCGKSGGTNTTVTQSDPPEYVAQAYQDLLARATEVSETPYTAYTGDLVADLTPTQLAAFQSISDASGMADPYYTAAQSALESSTGSIWDNVTQYSPEAVQQYYNPYLEDVINATMANIAETSAQQQTELQGNAVSAGAWGGDRAGVAAAELARQQALASNQTLAELQSSGYESALSAFQQQQAQELASKTTEAQNLASAASTYADLGTGAQSLALQQASAELQAGALEQQQAQNLLTSAYEQWAAEQEYPFLTTEFLANNVFGLPSTGTTTSTGTSPAASTASQLTGLGLTGLSLYGAIGGSKDGGRIGYNRGGIVGDGGRIPYKNGGKAKGYIYGGLVPTTSGAVPSFRSYVNTGTQRSAVGRGYSPMASSGSTAKTEAEKTLGQQAQEAAQTALLGKNAYKGAQALGDEVSSYFLPEAGEAFTGAEAASQAANVADFLGAASAPTAEAVMGGAEIASQAANTASFLGGAGAEGSSLLAAEAATPLLDAATMTAGTEAALAGAGVGAAEAGAAGGAAAAAEAGTLAAIAGPLGIAALVALPFLLSKDGGRIPYKSGGLVPKRKKMANGGEAEQDNNVADVILDGQGTMLATSEDNGDQEVVAGYVTPQETSSGEQVDPWMPLLTTGLAMMSGTSPDAMTNIGKAGLAGLAAYDQEKSAIAKRQISEAKARQEAAKLLEQSEWHKRQGDIQSEQNEITRQRNQQLSEYQGRMAGSREKEVAKGNYAPYEWTATDDAGNPISGLGYFDRETGDWKGEAPPKGAALKQKAQGTKSESVFETKYNAWLSAHPDDVNGALEYAGGRKVISGTEIRKIAANMAREEAKNMVRPTPEYIDERMQFWMDRLSGGDAKTQQQAPKPSKEGNGAKQQQAAKGTRENPIVPKTQSEIDNAPSGTIFNINGKLMVK